MHIPRLEQRRIFDAVLMNLSSDPEALRMDAELTRVDELLDDGELVVIVHRALGQRCPSTVGSQGAQRRSRKWSCECSSSST